LVAGLIERNFCIPLGATAMGELLAKVGLTAQNPLQRAYRHDPKAIEKWQREEFPAIARRAKASGGEVYFWDEPWFRADDVPVLKSLEQPAHRYGIAALASDIRPRVGLRYSCHRAQFTSPFRLRYLIRLGMGRRGNAQGHRPRMRPTAGRERQTS
jgi:hypothetical protein